MESENTTLSMREKYRIMIEGDYLRNKDYDAVKEIAEEILATEDIDGQASDFHNFAVSLADLNLNSLACKMLERGLSVYKSNVDLLANYLIYGFGSANTSDRCEEYYEALQSIDDKHWTWRAYSFSLDYLQSKVDRSTPQEDVKEFEERMNTILESYHKKFPDAELPYLAEADMYRGKNPQAERAALEKAVENLNSSPRCSIRYAEILINIYNDVANYEKALKYLDEALFSVSRELDIGYVHFLRGMCKLRLLNGEYTSSEKVNEIYKCFRIASLDALNLTPNSKKVMLKQISILEMLSEIEYLGPR